MVATNGMEALEQVQLSCPDLVVLDVVMPKLMATRFAVGKTDQDPNVPVVMCSSKGEKI